MTYLMVWKLPPKTAPYAVFVFAMGYMSARYIYIYIHTYTTYTTYLYSLFTASVTYLMVWKLPPKTAPYAVFVFAMGYMSAR